MKIAFEFNDGETAQQIVSSIVGLFGGSVAMHAPAVAGVSGGTGTASDDADDGAGTAANPNSLDANGIPHDARIHSEPAVITTKGVWRKKRGVADTLFASVTAELKARAAAGAGSVAQTGALTPPASLTPPPVLTPPATLAPPPLAAPGPYEKFVSFISDNIAPKGRMTPEWIADGLKGYGVIDAEGKGSIHAMQHQAPDKITQIHGLFAQAIGATL